MQVLRTPDERFSAVMDFPYPPRYAHIRTSDGTPIAYAPCRGGSRERRIDPVPARTTHPDLSLPPHDSIADSGGLPGAQDIPDAMARPMRDLFAAIPALPPREMGARLRENQFGAGFMYWIKYCSEHVGFVISDVVNLSAGGTLTGAQKAEYDAVLNFCRNNPI